MDIGRSKGKNCKSRNFAVSEMLILKLSLICGCTDGNCSDDIDPSAGMIRPKHQDIYCQLVAKTSPSARHSCLLASALTSATGPVCPASVSDMSATAPVPSLGSPASFNKCSTSANLQHIAKSTKPAFSFGHVDSYTYLCITPDQPERD